MAQQEYQNTMRRIDEHEYDDDHESKHCNGGDGVPHVYQDDLLPYSEQLVRQLIRSIRVISQNQVCVIYSDGLSETLMLDASMRRKRGRPKQLNP